MISFTRQSNFQPKFVGVGCFLEVGGKILLLKRIEEKYEGGKWGAPGGSIEEGESVIAALTREIREETGICIPEDDFGEGVETFVRYPDFDFIWHYYRVILSEMPVVHISREHSEWQWIVPDDALSLDLVKDEDICIRYFYDPTFQK